VTTASLFDTDTAELTAQLAEAERTLADRGREYTELYHRHHALLIEQARREREHAATVRRTVWQGILADFDRSVRTRIADDYRTLLRLIRELPAPEALTAVRLQADQMRERLDQAVAGSEQTAVVVELARLRGTIHTQGRQLHLAYLATIGGLDLGGTCRCPGCDLIRAVDMTEVVSPEGTS
jgi:hypothetical protein